MTVDPQTDGEEAVVLTREQADEIAEVLISMAVRLPLKYRDHGDALHLLKWRPS